MCTLINNKMFHEEDFDRILEGAEFDVEEMMDSPSLIEDDGSQDWTGVIKAAILIRLAQGGWQSVRGTYGDCEEEAPPPSLFIMTTDDDK